MKIDHVRACQMPFSGRKTPRLANRRDDYEKIGGVSGILFAMDKFSVVSGIKLSVELKRNLGSLTALLFRIAITILLLILYEGFSLCFRGDAVKHFLCGRLLFGK